MVCLKDRQRRVRERDRMTVKRWAEIAAQFPDNVVDDREPADSVQPNLSDAQLADLKPAFEAGVQDGRNRGR